MDDAPRERAAEAILISGLVCDAAFLAVAVWPGLPAGLDLNGRISGVPAPLLWAWIATGAVFLTLQLHYMMRFVWAQGQWVHVFSAHWEEHQSYAVAVIVVGLAAGAIRLFLLPL